MLRRTIGWSLDNPVLVAAGMILAVIGGLGAVRTLRVDAIPDSSDVQVIVYTRFPGQAPQVVEDQVTYPITTRMLAVPHAAAVRGYSNFGYSLVYAIFEDGTDLYWARSRVLEVLSTLADRLPEDAVPQLGPDATGVGWAYTYVLNSDRHGLDELRSLQDWYLRFGLTAIDGVAEVAAIGGFVRQYQVEVDPVRLRAYGLPLAAIGRAIARSNVDVGGRVIEAGERELMVRGRGTIGGTADLEQVVLGKGSGGVPILLRDVARISIGPEIRRGLADWNGEGETVGGIVIVRAGADTRATITRVKERLAELQKGLPEGVHVETAYDRTTLIDAAVGTLRRTLIEESIVVALVCLIFLLHIRSALVAIISLPLTILLAFVVMKGLDIGLDIMSLGGIAISIGVLVDGAIILVDNAHKHLEAAEHLATHEHLASGRSGTLTGGLDTAARKASIKRAAIEVGPTLFFTLLIITVSFLPIFALEAQEGRLFRPLAVTKTVTMAIASLLAVTAVPVLVLWFVRGRIRSEARNPISRLLRAVYTPILRLALRARWLVIVASILALVLTLVPLGKLGTEFMPPLWEGDVLYMPTTLPGISIGKAREILQETDRMLRAIPEVKTVFGKVGRAETATDPAPLSMLETTVVLEPPDRWRAGMTHERLIEEMDRVVRLPGLTNAWTMPIKTRLDMLSTGIRTPVGIKLSGPDLGTLETLAQEVEQAVRDLPGTRSVFAERVMGGTYLDFEVDRAAAARYGLAVADVQEVIQTAIGGVNVATAIEGLERYPINVRYPRELRDDPEALRQILVTASDGAQVPLGQLARLSIVSGPPMIKSEDARPNAWVYVDLTTTDVASWVTRAREAVDRVPRPEGYALLWSGQYESIARARARLTWIVPMTLGIILLILYLHTRSWIKTLIVVSAIPFSLIGSIWLLYLLDYNLSVAVWVGLIALAGLAAETGLVMLLYVDLAYTHQRDAGQMATWRDLAAAIDQGAVQRIRPKMMTVATVIIGLAPILWSTGIGADVMRRIAAPMVGGVITSFVAELLVFPALYFLWRGRGLSTSPLFAAEPPNPRAIHAR